jgi:hypothetical protein
MDMLDNNTFPPNVSLSPSNNSYLPSAANTHMDTNSMMMYNQQTPTHIQHHQNQNQMPNLFYRQASQAQQQTMYNNFVQPPPPPPPNQVAPGYYPMQQQSSSQQQRMPSATHPSQLNKRQTVMHQQQQQQRTPQQNNQQLQLYMSMNVTLPNVKSKKSFKFNDTFSFCR